MFLPETDWIKRWAKYTPKRLAIRDYDTKNEWSYLEMHKRVNALSCYLRDDLKVKRGDRIAVYSPNNAEYVFLFFASLRLGSILVPLNFRLMPRELDGLIVDCEPTLLVYDEDYKGQMKNLSAVREGINKISFEQITPFVTEKINGLDFEPDRQSIEEDLVMILYTSGTTGLPKGAKINHRMLYWNSINTELRLDINSEDHTQTYAPFLHTGGWNVLTTPFIHHGASLTLLNKFDPDLILELMEKEKTTLFFGVPTMMQMLADSPKFETVDLSSVRFAVVGGSPMSIPLINKWHKKGVLVRQGYGLTEVGPNCFSLHHDDVIRKRGSIGFPNFYVDVKVVDEQEKELGADNVGELLLRSPVVTPGYWGKEEETKKAISGGWFHTGDMVKYDEEGFFYVVDRKKNMFISGGENVYPADVERFLLTNENIKEVVVIGVPDEQWGEVGRAFIVLNDGITSDMIDFFEYCRGKLAKFKVPKYFEVIKEIPKNEAGKVDRARLG